MIRKSIKRQKMSKVYGNKLTKEEIDKNNKYGLYTPENAEMIVSSRGALSVFEFERKLKQINPRLFIVYRPEKVLDSEHPYGHPIRFADPLLPSGYDFTGTACGRAGENLIPAMTTYNRFKNSDGDYITRYNSFGWEAALEGVLSYLLRRGYSINRILDNIPQTLK